MPKFIHNTPPKNAIPFTGSRFKATWSQVQVARQHGELRLDVEVDTSDRGGPRRFAKRWHVWYLPEDISIQPWATKSMKQRALKASV